MRASPVAAALLLLAAPLAGCVDRAAEGPDVLSSFYPIEFLAARIAGPDLTVGTIVPPGVEPHEYEPTPGDVARVARADLVLLLGVGFEEWLDAVRGDADEAQFVTVTDGLPLRDNPDEEEAEEIPQDPHTWLDPVLFADMSRNVESALVDAYPEHADAFRLRGETLRADLAALHDDFEAGLADCEARVIVTNHAAFGYLAARYDFRMVAISGLEPEAEPSPSAMRRAVEEVRAHNVTVIFFEELVSPKVAEAIARETGATTAELSPIEGVPPEEAAGGADYLSKMRDDLAALREGMRCS